MISGILKRRALRVGEGPREPRDGAASMLGATEKPGERGGSRKRKRTFCNQRFIATVVDHHTHMVRPRVRRVGDFQKRAGGDTDEHDISNLQIARGWSA
ncbi:hypothetical protein D3C76_949950 [compost metagenome]